MDDLNAALALFHHLPSVRADSPASTRSSTRSNSLSSIGSSTMTGVSRPTTPADSSSHSERMEE